MTIPASGNKITVKSGRFGPYVTDGEYNATLRVGDDEATISLERAAELLAEKRAKGPAPKKRAAKKTAQEDARRRRGGQEDGGEEESQEERGQEVDLTTGPRDHRALRWLA